MKREVDKEHKNTDIDVLPTAGAMQLKRIVGAYSSAIVFVATCMDMINK